ncbi:hypothetical protein Pmar_PMAR010114 [Perkinsus marinus ATCC 50983]|uniref:Uncharacterized protein n=2 Tax=Perkinsus marinus (strain ATCC 50983 / TXsc) TaxID=423536 RepID=C5K4V9_PERM5|nr:hypothetical protein Pmar_PMAR010114 [Perkinsus marinus ATCC 50983]EER20381.1 hypothetical protein Pmar_PMAR010114 [Perkinsus marinus ATCC 50983]|eukprot:XP_002788585.1 hypothetical protein Pmar_PMAR010114 [Perkinsus marinus ATCC 50983]
MFNNQRRGRGCCLLELLLLLTLQGSARAAIASNTACECTSSCGTGLLSASKAWCYVSPSGCGVGTCSCLSASKSPYDFCDDSLGLLQRERERSRSEIEALTAKLEDLRTRLSLDDSTREAQEAALKEKEVQREELETVISSQKSTIAVVSWYSLWCAVAVAAVVSVLCLLFCLYKAFLLRKQVKASVETSPITEALLSPPARNAGKGVGTPSTEANSPARLPPETPSDVFPLHKSFSPSLGGQDIRSPFLAAGVSAGTGTPGSAHEPWSEVDMSRRSTRDVLDTPRLGPSGSQQRPKFHKPEITVDDEPQHSSTSREEIEKSTRAYYNPSIVDKKGPEGSSS